MDIDGMGRFCWRGDFGYSFSCMRLARIMDERMREQRDFQIAMRMEPGRMSGAGGDANRILRPLV